MRVLCCGISGRSTRPAASSDLPEVHPDFVVDAHPAIALVCGEEVFEIGKHGLPFWISYSGNIGGGEQASTKSIEVHDLLVWQNGAVGLATEEVADVLVGAFVADVFVVSSVLNQQRFVVAQERTAVN